MLKTLVLCSVSLTLLASHAAAAPISLIDGDLDDSGWTVSPVGAAFSIDSIDVDLTSAIKTVTITVTSKYNGYELDGGDIEFPVAKFIFNQVRNDASTVDRIIIQSEDIYNGTGMTWGNYEWLLSPAGAADFNQTASAGWNVSPFAAKTFVNGDYLSASTGHVPSGDGSSPDFIPNSILVIDVDLTSSGSPIAFDLKERVTMPVPEPATLLFICTGCAVSLARKRGCMRGLPARNSYKREAIKKENSHFKL